MNRMWEGFVSYAVIAIANTVIHWQLFFIFRTAFELSQAYSNLLAFCAAGSFSFYANALYTFAMPATAERYLKFMLWLGSLSFAAGSLGDHWPLPGILTVILFSITSLAASFLMLNWLIFRRD